LAFSSALDKMLDDPLQYGEICLLTATKEQKMAHLDKMMNNFSGKLASNNMFCLDKSIKEKMVKMNKRRKKQVKYSKEKKCKKTTIHVLGSCKNILINKPYMLTILNCY
jgi:hypothetical protein